MPKQSPAPAEGDITKPFWDAANEDRLIVQRCVTCTDLRGLTVLQFPPEPTCVWCGLGEEVLEWFEVCGRGTIDTYGILHDAAQRQLQPDQPLNVAVISLEEDPRCQMLSHLRDTPVDEIPVGATVEVIFEVTPATGQKVPEWRVVS